MNPKWQNLPAVFIAGMLGGLAGWFIGVSSSGATGSHWGFDILAGILGGGIAGIIGVFLLANTDPTQFAKMMSFALVCGLSWPAIIAAGKSLVANATVHKEVVTATETLQQDLARPPSAPADVTSLGANTTKLAEKLPSVVDPEVRKEAVQTATKAVDKLQAVAPEQPQAVSALVDIARKAGASGSTNLKDAATDSLEKISRNERAAPEVREKATAAVTALGKM